MDRPTSRLITVVWAIAVAGPGHDRDHGRAVFPGTLLISPANRGITILITISFGIPLVCAEEPCGASKRFFDFFELKFLGNNARFSPGKAKISAMGMCKTSRNVNVM